MYRLSLTVLLAGAAWLGEAWLPRQEPQDRAPAQADSALSPEGPPAPWLQGDPADSLYRAARAALSRRDFRQAAALFASLPERFPRSGYAADALYWQAFSLYRVGGEPALRGALEALRAQRERFPQAATRGDAGALERRIQGELARQGDTAAAAVVAEAAAEAAEATEAEAPEECSEDDDKLAALNALIHMDAERARPILRRVLARRDPASACLRRKAVFLVAQGGGEAAGGVLLDAARSDPDREVREQAVFWLSQVGGAGAVGTLDSILRSSPDPRIREKAIFALSQQGSPEARRALRAYAERADVGDDLRGKVIFWIGQSEDAEDAEYLRALFGRTRSEELRGKILFSLSQMGGRENETWLLRVARDRQQPLQVRKQAIFSAGQSGVSLAELGALYAETDDRAIREQLLLVYSQRDEPAAVDRLLEVARRDADSELRRRALFWLGQSDDPRAAAALQEIIEEP